MDQRRDHSRVDAKIPLSARLLPDREIPGAVSQVGDSDSVITEFPIPPDIPNKVLNDWMKMINAKLDALLKVHSRQSEGLPSLPMTSVNISAGGVRFRSTSDYDQGDIIEIKMTLPLEPPVFFSMIADVIRVDTYTVAAKFINTSESVKSKIADFVFHREREIMMSKRESM
ncbi:MAG TPA: PilZ domain-containing protein [Nitrospirae bacterium]|nr:PilZ domain-containing protein [Nitrospirota bacterium]